MAVVGAGPRNCSWADSIARETRATSPLPWRRWNEKWMCGWVLERKYVYVYGIVDYAADGADSMINMFDCAWPVWDDTKGREGAKWRWEWDFEKEIGRWRFRWLVEFVERARILSFRSDTRLDWWWEMCGNIEVSVESCIWIILI